MTESTTSSTRHTEPDLCRVSVIGRNTQVDVGLPATVPIASFISDLVRLIDSRNPDITETDEDAVPQSAQHWTLSRVGQDALSPSRSLTDAEVYDGELLVLRPVAAKEIPALFDDVIDAVSRLTSEEFRGWTATAARWLGLVLSTVSVVAVLVVLAVLRSQGDPVAPALILAVAGCVAYVAAGIVARRYDDPSTAVWLLLDGLLLLSGGAALLVPGSLSDANLLLGCTVALVAAVAGIRVIGGGATLCSAAATLGLIGLVASGVHLVWGPAVERLSAGLLVAGIIVLSMVPRLSAMLARLPIPPVPTAGAAIDPADHEPRPTIEGIGAIGATALPSAVGLGQRARLANQFQTGLVVACTVSMVLGALGAADPIGGRWQGPVLAAVTAIILCLRGRSFADLVQATVLIAGGGLLGLALLAVVGAGRHESPTLLAGLLVVFAAGAVAFGVVGPRIEATPVIRRTIEIIEYMLIISLVPLILWIMGIYGMARDLSL
ncbi:type VII secretion integral membrane protein EccD [Nocardia sp. BMG51109]|uniref:type VII secretion integral membrane protein EccD n=1 Tax=Nocardia sp. BMG51109 TaxID=1056816 RepID=UPI00046667CB|nr:type VII secretion integral membrane protein EccD [Nocardia sp. BMG51109]